MFGQRDVHLENIRGIQAELLQILDGMDYCLDWKPEADEWSAREVIYHLLDTPPGGIPAVLLGMFSGELKEYDQWSDRSNLTPERQVFDMERVLEDIGRFFQGMKGAVAAAAEEDFDGKAVLAHLKSRGRDEERTARVLLEGPFARHWRGHLEQVRELREALGV